MIACLAADGDIVVQARRKAAFIDEATSSHTFVKGKRRGSGGREVVVSGSFRYLRFTSCGIGVFSSCMLNRPRVAGVKGFLIQPLDIQYIANLHTSPPQCDSRPT